MHSLSLDPQPPDSGDPSSHPPTGTPDGSSPALDSRGMAGAAAVVMLFFVLSRATGLLREIIIGAQFGTSAQLDAYLAAFRVPDLLFQLVAGGALGSAFIPTFSGYWVRKDRTGAWLLFSRLLNWVTLLLVVLAGLAVAFALPLVQYIIAPGFSPQQQRLTAGLMRWMLASTVVFGASGLVMGALNAVHHFALPAAAPILYNLAIILSAWLLAPHYGVHGLVAGVVAGAGAHLLVQLPALWRRGARYRASLAWRDPGVREVARLMGPRVLGILFVQLHFLVNTILASGLAAGSLSALNYAWLILLLPQGIFAQAVATVAFPTFSAQVAARRQEDMARTFGRTLQTVLFLSIPAAVGLAVLRIPLIQVLLERGRFTPESTQAVAYALQFYALGLVAHAVVEIVVRAYYALHDTATPVAVGVGAMLLNVGLSLWWIGPLGHGGLALANTVATSVEMLLLLFLLGRRMDHVDLGGLALATVRCTGPALLMGGVLWIWLRWLDAGGLPQGWQTGGWLAAGGGIALGSLVYAAVSFLLGSQELRSAVDLLRRRNLM